MSATPAARPGSVTLVAALTWIAAILDLIAGAALIWLSFNLDSIDTTLTEGSVRWYGYGTLFVGILTAAVAAGLAMGSQGARVLVIIVMVLRLAAAGYALLALGGVISWQGIVGVVIALTVIALLSTRRASDFFRGR